MKRSELKRAYDITDPTRAQKDKMLDAILSEPSGTHTRKVIPAVLALVIFAGAILIGAGFLMGRGDQSLQLESPPSAGPTEISAEPPAKADIPKGSTLFETMFVSTAEGTIGSDLESFSTALDQNGYSSYEEEGILYVDDPENPDSYLYGVLTNESGTVEIAQLGYCCGANEEKREVHVIFFDDGTKYYLDIPSGEGMEVQQVQSLEELKEYLGIG